MKLIDELKKFRNTLLGISERDYEFDAELEDHEIPNSNYYRLHYVEFYRRNEQIDPRPDNIGITNWPCSTFMLPEGMTREEGFKILSYLTDFIEKRKDTEVCSLKSVRTLDGVLDLDRFGFQKVTTNPKDVIDLFTVSGRILLFKQSEFYEKYFEWYTENVTRREIEKIYKKYNMTFEDIIWLDKPVQRTLRKKDEN